MLGSLEMVLTTVFPSTQLPFTCSWITVTASSITPSSSTGQSKGLVAVTIIPSSASEKILKYLTVYNPNTEAYTVIIRYKDGVTTRILASFALSQQQTLTYTDCEGFSVQNSADGGDLTEVSFL